MRALAVVAVLAAHLGGWPRGGTVGIDVFFVVSGFFVTDLLLRSAESTGSVSVGSFWLDRARRILPVAILVAVATFVASTVLIPSRAHDTGVDALFSLAFLANWHFASRGADASMAADAASPLQHYWPLAIEEQFYVVWPLLVLAITVVVARRAWSRERRLGAVAATSGVVTAASLAWATYETVAAPHWAFFNSFARVWELGAGAILATAVGALATLPVWLRPLLSWAGVALIVASLFLIDPAAGGFPVPWALLPVVGTLLVIAAGVGSEPLFQPLLRNRAATYLGDLSYALYLVHWPVIVLLSAAMETNVYYYAAALSLSFGLAIACHHFVEEPLRQVSWAAVSQARQDMRHGLYQVQRATKVAAVAALVLITLAVIAFAARPDRFEPAQHALPCCGHVG
ncbi:MAG: acyltransferase [Mycobacterium kyogaense]|uniref:acyltransferase family protein n=1 Tax=Mycobacterium kyogaense TaxID=2212479 RepID=UPI002FF9BFFE